MARSVMSTCCKYMTRPGYQYNLNISSLCAARTFADNVKDKERPKKPSIFFKYRDNVIDVVSMKHPDAPYNEKIKIIGEMYRNMDSEEKKKLLEESKKLMEEYSRKKQEWLKTLTAEDQMEKRKEFQDKKERKARRTLKKKLKDTGKPKKPVSAYVLFLVEYHKSAREKKYAGLKSPSEKFKASKEIFGEASRAWKEMPDKEKQVYKDAAEKKSKEYKVKLDKWKSDMLKAGNAELFHKKPVPKSKAKKQLAKRKQTRKPKKLPTKKPLRKSLNLDPED